VKFFGTRRTSRDEEAASWGVLAGVTTNPTLYSRVGGKLADFTTTSSHLRDCGRPVPAEMVCLLRDEIRAGG
jgi:transaldolase